MILMLNRYKEGKEQRTHELEANQFLDHPFLR
jgi:hypothetical protein